MDEAKATLRAFLRREQYQSELCHGSDCVCGEVEDEEDDRCEEQTDVFVGPNNRDEHRRSSKQEDTFQDSHGDRKVFSYHGLYDRGREAQALGEG